MSQQELRFRLSIRGKSHSLFTFKGNSNTVAVGSMQFANVTTPFNIHNCSPTCQVEPPYTAPLKVNRHQQVHINRIRYAHVYCRVFFVLSVRFCSTSFSHFQGSFIFRWKMEKRPFLTNNIYIVANCTEFRHFVQLYGTVRFDVSWSRSIVTAQ